MTGPLHPYIAQELARLRAAELTARARRPDRDRRRRAPRTAAGRILPGAGGRLGGSPARFTDGLHPVSTGAQDRPPPTMSPSATDPRVPKRAEGPRTRADVTPGSDGAVAGLDAAWAALAAGQPVVLPNATPLAYMVVATSPREVNRLKGRPLHQNVGITLYDDADWRSVQPALDLAPDGFERMLELMRRELLSFLAPLRHGAELPEWLRPAVRDGWLGVFAGRWRPLTPLWERFPRLFGSSANRTGQPPAGSAAEAAAVLGDTTVVVDGDAQRDVAATRGATTILRMWPDGTIALHRTGAHDAGLSAHDYLARLATWNTPNPTPYELGAIRPRR